MLLILLGFASSLLAPALSQVSVNLTGVPLCAQSCLANNTGQDDGCAITDIACLCSSINYINALSCCLEETCNEEEQKIALAFDIELCNTVNVSIPNFLGCSPLSTSVRSGVKSSTTDTGQSSSGTSVSQTSSMGTVTVSTVMGLQPAVTTAGGGPVAKFTGGKLFEGTCTTPVFNVYTMPTGGILEYPWVGCSDQQPRCCPFNVREEGPLTVCPMDYFTTNSACCPSGWSVYTTAIAGQTPCYTTPALPLIPPSATSSSSGAQTSIISTELFTLRYELATPKPALGIGAKAGIGAGAGAGAVFLAALVLCIIRSRRRHASAGDERNMPGDDGIIEPEKRSETFSQNNGISLSELPSPDPRSPQARSERNFWAPGGTTPPVPRIDSPPMELPGSTFINEHHPAYVSGGGVLEYPPSVMSQEREPPHTPDDVGNLIHRS